MQGTSMFQRRYDVIWARAKMGVGEPLQWTKSAWKKDLRALWRKCSPSEIFSVCICIRHACETPTRESVASATWKHWSRLLLKSLFLSTSTSPKSMSVPVNIFTGYACMCATIGPCCMSFSIIFQLIVCVLGGGVYVQDCESVCTCIYVCIRVCVQDRCWMSFLDKGSHWTWDTLNEVDLVTSELQRASCVYLPSSGVIVACYHAWIFMWVLGTQTQVSMLVWQKLSPQYQIKAFYAGSILLFWVP